MLFRNRILTTITLLLYLFILFSIWPILLIFKNREEPSLIVLSLTTDQIFKNSTPVDVLKFFREERFREDYVSSELIIECRSFRVFLTKCHKNFVLDVPFYLLTHFLPLKKSVKEIIRNTPELLKETSPLGISKIKRLLIDKSIWESYISGRNSELFLATTLSTMINPTLPFTLEKHPLVTRIMFWYSTNIKPINTYRESIATPEYFFNLGAHFDRHIIWDTSQFEFMSKFNAKDMRIRGSMLFQPRILDLETKKSTRVLFFDITPVKETTGFYSETMSLDTLNSLVNVIEIVNKTGQVRLDVAVKPKRKYSSIFSKNYISRLKSLERQGKLVILSANSNLYEEISKARVVVCTPFTSPAFIARELNKPACFFTRASDDWELPKQENGFDVFRTETALIDFILKNSIV